MGGLIQKKNLHLLQMGQTCIKSDVVAVQKKPLYEYQGTEEEKEDTKTAEPIDESSILGKMFKKYDLDGSGMISLDELKQVCKEAGKSEEDAVDMFENADVSGDGKVSYTEFIKMMVNV